MWRADRILAGTDFSKQGNAAVELAFALARRMRSELDLIHVLAPGPQPLTGYEMLDELLLGGADPERLRERALAVMAELATRYGPPAARCHALLGSAPEQLLGERHLLEADLLVLGAARLRSLRRFVLGSVADRALRRPGCPLLLIRRLPKPGRFQKILVGLEFPDAPSPWLAAALGLAHHLDAELVALHVLPPEGYVSNEHRVELEPETVPERLRRLLEKTGSRVPTQISVRRGDAASVIPRVAKRLGCDLAVLGAERAPSGWPGRVADRVARAGLPALLYVWPEPEGEEL